MKPKLTKKAFTLIEVLLALALGGTLLTAGVILLMTYMQIWLKQGKTEDYNSQVENITRFLSVHLQNPQGIPRENENDFNLFIGNIESSSSDQMNPFLVFFMKELPPFAKNPKESFRGPAIAQLEFRENSGLFLTLKARVIKQIGVFAKISNEFVKKTFELSKLVKNFEYLYYEKDLKRWKTEKKFTKDKNSGKFLIPNYIKLTFKNDDKKEIKSSKISKYIYISGKKNMLPLF